MQDYNPPSPTIFGKILSGEIETEIIYEDDYCIAFRDITPVAPTHILIIPTKYIATINDATEEDAERLGHLMLAGAAIAKAQGCAEDGYRLVMNCNKDGGQSVYHIHLHLIAGRQMTWPPG